MAGSKRGEKEDISDANFDEWSGYGGSLFAGTTEDAEDKDADTMFSRIDEYMDSRRRKKREEKFIEEEKKVAKQ